jgi:quinate dehydrogenase
MTTNHLPSKLYLSLQDSYQYGSSLFQRRSKNIPSAIYLLSYPLARSLAPLLHNNLFSLTDHPWKFHLLESMDKQDLLDLLNQDGCVGAAVTMPHKVSFMPLVTDVTDEGKDIGAINTIFLRLDTEGNRRWIGSNTDCIGVREAFLRNLSPEELAFGYTQPALVIGAGGACRSAIYALHHWLGVAKIYSVNRLEVG